MKKNTPDFRILLGDLETPIYDLQCMSSILENLWSSILRAKKDDGPYISLTLGKHEIERFSFAVCDIGNRCDKLVNQWDAAIDGNEVQL